MPVALAVAAGDEAWDPEEGSLGLGERQVGDGLAGGLGVSARGVHRILDGAVAT